MPTVLGIFCLFLYNQFEVSMNIFQDTNFKTSNLSFDVLIVCSYKKKRLYIIKGVYQGISLRGIRGEVFRKPPPLKAQYTLFFLIRTHSIRTLKLRYDVLKWVSQKIFMLASN